MASPAVAKTKQKICLEYCDHCRTFHGEDDPCNRRAPRFTGHLLDARHPYTSPGWSKGKLAYGHAVPSTGNHAALIAMFSAAEAQHARDANPYPEWPDPRYQDVRTGFYGDVTALDARLRSVVDRKYKFRYWSKDTYSTKAVPAPRASQRWNREPVEINWSSPDTAWKQIMASWSGEPERYLFCYQGPSLYAEAPAEAPSRYAPYAPSASWNCDSRYPDRYPTSLPNNEWLISEAAIKEELELFAASPLIGFEAAWFHLGVAHGVLKPFDLRLGIARGVRAFDPLPIESLVEIVRDGGWRESTNIGKFLRTNTKRLLEKQSKAIGIFWWACDKEHPWEKVNNGPVIKYYGPREKVWVTTWDGERKQVLRRIETSLAELPLVSGSAEGDGTFGDQRPENYAMDAAEYKATRPWSTPWHGRGLKPQGRRENRELERLFYAYGKGVPELARTLRRIAGLDGWEQMVALVRAMGVSREQAADGATDEQTRRYFLAAWKRLNSEPKRRQLRSQLLSIT